MAKLAKLDDIVSLCKRRGFIFQSSEIYGGLASCYDYGPLGVELKNNVKKAWWKSVVQMRDDVVGLDCSILMHPLIWKASGHADHFADLVAECKKCNTRTRVDHLKDKAAMPSALQVSPITRRFASGSLIPDSAPRNFAEASTTTRAAASATRSLPNRGTWYRGTW